MVDNAYFVARAWDLPDDSPVVAAALAQGRKALLDHGVVAPELACWDDLRRYLDDLYQQRAGIGDSERSLQLANAALSLPLPLAAVVPALVVATEWEGPSHDMLMRSSQGARNWGWHGLVLPLARVLLRAGATWSAGLVADTGLGIVSMARDRMPAGFPTRWIDEAVAGFRQIVRDVEHRQRVAREELAWALRRECAPAGAGLRPVIAALWWTQGSAWHAFAVARDELVPTVAQLQTIVTALLRASADPLHGSVGALLWTEPWAETLPPTLQRRLENALPSPGYERIEAPFRALGVSPSRMYARALVDWFAGRHDDGHRLAIKRLAPLVATVDAHAGIRVRALELLLTEAGEPEWQLLAADAAAAVAADNWTGVEDPYDRSVDLPLHHLPGNAQTQLDALERQRSAALEFALAVEGATDGELVSEIRGLRLVTRLPQLPGFLTRASRTLEAGDPPLDWSDADAAAAALRSLRPRLNADAGPGDRSAGTLAEFAAALHE